MYQFCLERICSSKSYVIKGCRQELMPVNITLLSEKRRGGVYRAGATIMVYTAIEQFCQHKTVKIPDCPRLTHNNMNHFQIFFNLWNQLIFTLMISWCFMENLNIRMYIPQPALDVDVLLKLLISQINPFKSNGFFHSYYLEKSILHFSGVRLIFSSLA